MSKELYRQNMKAFEKAYPQYAHMVRTAKIDVKYEIEQTSTHMPTLKVDGKYWYDKENPAQGCADNFASYGVNHCRMAVFLGFGLGYDPVFYTEQLSLKNITEHIVVIEKDPALIKKAMWTLNLVPFFEQKRIKILLALDETQLFNSYVSFLQADHKFYLLRATQFYYNMEQFEFEKNYYNMAMQTFKKAASYVIMYYGNDTKDSLIGYHNMFANLEEIMNNGGINLLKDKFEGVPAVCVATGPSLDKNIELLRGLQDKAVIIAADASLKPMTERNIKPHMVTSLEREMAVVDLFKGIPEEKYNDVYLCGCPVLYNEVYQEYKGPRIIAYRMFDHFKWLGIDRGLLEIKLSSGNMNFKIAEYLGCDPIILIGQDLCIYENRTNATGASLGEEQISYLNEPKMFVKGNYQDTVETTRSLNMFLEAFTVDVHNYSGTCINATEAGAYIPGTKIMPFAEAVEKYLTKQRNIKTVLDDTMQSFVPNLKEKDMVLSNIKRSLCAFYEAKRACNEAYEWLKKEKPRLEQCIGDPDKEYLNQCFNKMLQYKNELQKDHYTWQLYFAHIAQSVFVNHELYINSFPKDYKDIGSAKAKALVETIEFFEIIGGLINICIEDLEKERDKLENI